MMRTVSFFLSLLLVTSAFAQEERLISQLKMSETAPEGLLSSKSAVLFDSKYNLDELGQIQQGFQQIGIDADFYIDAEKALSGIDPERAYSAYLTTREIKFLLILTKGADGYSFYATEFSNTMNYVTKDAFAWKVSSRSVDGMLAVIYRDSWLREKKQNFLINDIPEMEIQVPMITGRRSELFPLDLKIDNMAIPKVEDVSMQAEVDTLFKHLYPYPEKAKVVAMPADEKDLVKQGFQFVLLYVRLNGKASHEILGYDMTKAFATAYGSMTYQNGTAQVKTISADLPVYKFYIKHLRSGNVFLGRNWDADETLAQALKNYLMGLRTELKLN
jgi:hypothetical protein